MQFGTVSEVAQHLGVSKSQVSRQSRAWGLVGADRRIDVEAYRARRAAEVNPLMAREPAAIAAPTVTSAAAEHKALQAQLLQLRINREQGKQLDAGDVASEIGEAGGVFRSVMLGLPSKAAVELARETDPDRIEIILTTHINAALAELDEALGAALTTLADEQDTDEDP